MRKTAFITRATSGIGAAFAKKFTIYSHCHQFDMGFVNSFAAELLYRKIPE
jgi:hypothetical protein